MTTETVILIIVVIIIAMSYVWYDFSKRKPGEKNGDENKVE
ncbi:MAG TPA: hypothetical protein VHP32_04380 [Ignavibacteria bacterium]|nr:hypothetical protein [Ignavibacteria bacterium]